MFLLKNRLKVNGILKASVSILVQTSSKGSKLGLDLMTKYSDRCLIKVGWVIVDLNYSLKTQIQNLTWLVFIKGTSLLALKSAETVDADWTFLKILQRWLVQKLICFCRPGLSNHHPRPHHHGYRCAAGCFPFSTSYGVDFPLVPGSVVKEVNICCMLNVTIFAIIKLTYFVKFLLKDEFHFHSFCQISFCKNHNF